MGRDKILKDLLRFFEEYEYAWAYVAEFEKYGITGTQLYCFDSNYVWEKSLCIYTYDSRKPSCVLNSDRFGHCVFNVKTPRKSLFMYPDSITGCPVQVSLKMIRRWGRKVL